MTTSGRPTTSSSWASLLAAGGVYGFGNFRSIVGERRTDKDKFSEAPPGYFSAPERPFYPKILRFNAIWPSCVIARTDFLSSIGGFDKRLPRAATEDLEFSLRCNQSVAPVIQYQPLAWIRRHGGNLSGDKMRVCLWDVEALIWARDHHTIAPQYADIFAAEIIRRRRLALEIAFTLGDTRSVRALASLLGNEVISPKLLVKTLLCQSRLVPGSALRALFGSKTQRVVSLGG